MEARQEHKTIRVWTDAGTDDIRRRDIAESEPPSWPNANARLNTPTFKAFQDPETSVIPKMQSRPPSPASRSCPKTKGFQSRHCQIAQPLLSDVQLVRLRLGESLPPGTKFQGARKYVLIDFCASTTSQGFSP
ncbi:hypothetical protein E4U43_002163 [Claviceps pusilla]|uniref:Uncharacterized protein n=1 Tax=Claviceps pusilla TaxID=123648 RepID=A0A9P7N913_9HYPO|nr:hypothetical protein E4U43_002163 [Claviceps pusilla]